METLALATTPQFLQTHDRHNNHGYEGRHHNDGITTKDRLHLSSDALNDAFRDTVKDIAAVGIAVEKNGRSTELSVEKTAAATSLSVEKTAAANQVALSKLMTDLSLSHALATANTDNINLGNFKDALFYASQNATASALASANSTAAILAAQAACCCELKEKIASNGEKTRDLIASNESLRLANLLTVAQNELSLLRMKVALPTIPV